MTGDTPPSLSETTDTALRTCPECGSDVASRSAFCDVCGAPLGRETSPAPLSSSSPSSYSPAAERTRGRYDLLWAGLYVSALAVLLYFVAMPEEVKGPPTGRGQAGMGGQLPQGHPETGAGGEGGAPNGAAPGGSMTQRLPPEVLARLEKVADSLEGVLKQRPTDDSARLHLANAYYDLDRHPDAVKLYREYLERHPKDLGARTDMAVSMASMQAMEDAVAELRQVLATDPRFQKAAFNLAMVHMFRREKDSTIAWLRNTVAIDSTSGPGRNAADILQGLESAHGGGSGSHPLPETP